MAWVKLVVFAVGLIGAVVVTAIRYYRNIAQEQQYEGSSGGRRGGESQGERPGGEAPRERPRGEAPGERPGGEAPRERPGGEAPRERPGGEAPGESRGGEAPGERRGGEAPGVRHRGEAPGVRPGGEAPGGRPGGEGPGGERRQEGPRRTWRSNERTDEEERRSHGQQYEGSSGGGRRGEAPGEGLGGEAQLGRPGREAPEVEGRHEGPRRARGSNERTDEPERSRSHTVRRRQVWNKPEEHDKRAEERQTVKIRRKEEDESESRHTNVATRQFRQDDVNRKGDESESRQRKVEKRQSRQEDVNRKGDESESRRKKVATRQSRKEVVNRKEETSLVLSKEEKVERDVQPGSGNSPNIDGRVSVAQQHFSRKTNRSQETKMEVPRNNIGVWEFGKENFLTSVPKVWPVSDCIAHVRNKIGKHGYGDLDLWVKNRCIMLDKKKSLSDYPGLKSLHVVRRPSSRNPHPSHQTSRADDTDPFSDDTCVGMCCGHAISPDNLYNYAWQKIQNGATEVTCPAVPDVNKPGEQCSKVWEFKSISLLACLSDDENYLFCDRLFLNWLEKQADVYLCPVCNEAIGSSCTNVFKCFNCENNGKSHSFCVKCNRVAYHNFCFNSECQESLPKIRALLRDCRMRTLIGVPNCPSVRACPMCNCVIEFDEEDLCKHMTCPRNTCQAKFCFICLKVKTDKYYYPCGGAFEPCQPAPRQCI